MTAWWRDSVIYQVYVRSFGDSNGDGHGDLPGIRDRLDYLEWLGVDVVWLTPIHPSPNADWGYDVADYYDVHPDYGTLADFDALVADASARGLRIVLDLVPNHTSDQHAWFHDAAKRDWYVWADEPNNWESVFGGAAWTYREDVGRWYLHTFLPQQPDLNWWNEEVRAAFDDILRFWFRRGVAGFRIDVAHAIVEDRELRDNPLDAMRFPPRDPETHNVLRRFRRIADEFESSPVLIGETWVTEFEELAAFYGSDDELHLAMNFPFALASLDVGLRSVVEQSDEAYPPEAWPAWVGSNHDIVRFPTRWCGGDEAKIRCALLTLLTVRGTPILYYGDELGMEQVEIPAHRQLDLAHHRDGARTPMPWARTPEGEWWLPYGDLTRNVAAMRDDPRSTLAFTRELLALRRATPDLQTGAYATLRSADGVWAWRRGASAIVAVNLSGQPGSVDGITGVVRVDTRQERAGETVAGRLDLAPWEAVVLLPQ